MNTLDRIMELAVRLVRMQADIAAKKAERTAERFTQQLLWRIAAAAAAIAGLAVLLTAMYGGLALVMPPAAALALVGALLMVIALVCWLAAGAYRGGS